MPQIRHRSRRRVGPILAVMLSFSLLACGRAMPGPKAPPPPQDRIVMAQNQPGTFTPRLSPNVTTTPAPRSMAPPPPPARPPTAGTQNFGHWQQEGNHFRWTPGTRPGPSGGTPFWVPGHMSTDSAGNQVWVPGYWR
jgi:hypothetical protein